jgi:hypothetical protein
MSFLYCANLSNLYLRDLPIEIPLGQPFEWLLAQRSLRYLKATPAHDVGRLGSAKSARASASSSGSNGMNLDTLNRYVLGVVGVFAVLLYLGMMLAGISELMLRLSKRGGSRKRLKVGTQGAPCPTPRSRFEADRRARS